MNRRQFLAGLGAARGVVPAWAQNVRDSSRDVTITGVEALAVKVPPASHAGSAWMFVKVLTNKPGLAGYGEVYTLGIPFSPAVLQAMIRDFGEKLAVGENPYHIESLFQRGYAYEYSHHPDFTSMGILSAIEMACWDIAGKDLNKPVYDLLGGPVREKIRTYTYINSAGSGEDETPLWRNPEACAQRARHYADLGFTAVKLDPVLGAEVSRAIADYGMIYPVEESVDALERSEKVIGAVREAVGPRCDILLGTHGQFTAAGAIRFAKRLERFDPLWFEEALPPENMGEMALVARSTSIPLCTGERLSTKYEFARLIESKAAAIFNFDLGRVGGMLEARKIAAMAEASYLQIAPHLWGGPMIAAASLQIATCCANFLIQESMETFAGFHAELLKAPIEWKNGYVRAERISGEAPCALARSPVLGGTVPRAVTLAKGRAAGLWRLACARYFHRVSLAPAS